MQPQFLVFTGIGLLLFAYAFVAAASARKARKWNPIEGKVVSTSVEKIEILGTPGYSLWRPCVQYSYAMGGLLRLDSTLSLDSRSYRYKNISEAQQFLVQYPAHKAVPVYASANGEAVLLKDIDWHRKSHYLAIGSAGALVFVVGILLALTLQ